MGTYLSTQSIIIINEKHERSVRKWQRQNIEESETEGAKNWKCQQPKMSEMESARNHLNASETEIVWNIKTNWMCQKLKVSQFERVTIWRGQSHTKSDKNWVP